MSYRGFSAPEFAKHAHTTDDWMDWLIGQPDLLIPVAPMHPQACRTCHGASGYLDGGPTTWPECVNCHGYDNAVDAFIPITYSIDAGLESMLHRYKDFSGYSWLRWPLASLLHEFLDVHRGCVEAEAGGPIDVATTVPPNDPRGFQHLDQLISGVVEGDPLMRMWHWDTTFLTRNASTPLPPRGRLAPDAYLVEPFVVEGSRVLLLDDTWTSGRSAASAAAALKNAGARRVVVLTLGRQLNLSNGYGSTQEIYEHQVAEQWRPDVCAGCG
jgi:predicted amidophosphoribosyltransferase